MQLNWHLEKVILSLSGLPFTGSRLPYPVFDTADALLISEVKMLLEHRKAQYESQEEDHELSEVGQTNH